MFKRKNGRSEGSRLISFLCLLAVSLSSPESPLAATVTDLGTLGGPTSIAMAINNAGLVVGVADTNTNAQEYHGFLYDGVMRDLGTLGGSHSWAVAINNAGQIVGNSQTSQGVDHGFLFSNGVMTDLGTLGGGYSSANGINNAGQVVGNSTTKSGANRAFIYSNGTMKELGPSKVDFSAMDINDAGQVAGYLRTSTGNYHACLLGSDGILKDLGTLGGSNSMAMSINAAGQVVGYADTALGSEHGFLYSNGIMKDLGTLGTSMSRAYDVNNLGQVVGGSPYPANMWEHAFVYDGAMSDLGTLVGSSYSDARGINDAGQVAGDYTRYSYGDNHAYIYTPDSPPSPTPSAVVAPLQTTAGLIMTTAETANFASYEYFSTLGANHVGVDLALSTDGKSSASSESAYREVNAICNGNLTRIYPNRNPERAFIKILHPNCNGKSLVAYYGHVSSTASVEAASSGIGTIMNWQEKGFNNSHLHLTLDSNINRDLSQAKYYVCDYTVDISNNVDNLINCDNGNLKKPNLHTFPNNKILLFMGWGKVTTVAYKDNSGILFQPVKGLYITTKAMEQLGFINFFNLY